MFIPEPVEDVLAGGRRQDLLDAQQGVIARCAHAQPVVRQRLVALEDLLDDDPAVARRVGEHREVAARVGKAVRVVDPEAVDGAVPEERHEQRMGRREDDRVLDAHRHQGGHVEEASVVQGLPRLAPTRQTIGLRLDEFGQRQRLGAGPDRELVAVVPEHPFATAGPTVLGEHHVTPLDGLADRPTEHGHEDPVVLDVPVDVEPRGIRTLASLAQQRQRGALRWVGRGTVMWLGTTSTITPRPCSRAAATSRSKASRPPASSWMRVWSSTS